MEDNQLIDQYISGALDEQAKALFERRLETDADFAKQFEEVKSLQAGIRLSHLEDKLDFLKEIESEEKGKSKVVNINKTQNRPIYKWLVAAAIALAVGVLVWQNGQSDLLSNDEIFAENFVADKSIYEGTTRGEGVRSDCYKNYDQQKWNATIDCILNLISTEERDIDYYYLGISYLGSDMPKKAIASFDKMIRTPDGISQNQVYWYRGLANVYAEELDKAKEELSKIDGGLRKNQAKKVINAIEELETK